MVMCTQDNMVIIKGTVMQTDKALINYRLRVSKSILKILHYGYL